MQKRRFTEEQIIAALREAEVRAKVAGVCRKCGILNVSEPVFV